MNRKNGGYAHYCTLYKRVACILRDTLPLPRGAHTRSIVYKRWIYFPYVNGALHKNACMCKSFQMVSRVSNASLCLFIAHPLIVPPVNQLFEMTAFSVHCEMQFNWCSYTIICWLCLNGRTTRDPVIYMQNRRTLCYLVLCTIS